MEGSYRKCRRAAAGGGERIQAIASGAESQVIVTVEESDQRWSGLGAVSAEEEGSPPIPVGGGRDR